VVGRRGAAYGTTSKATGGPGSPTLAASGGVVDDVLTNERRPPIAARFADTFRWPRLRAGRDHERVEAASERVTACGRYAR
jgi:hypothetical protein